jgi:hypothetical protein
MGRHERPSFRGSPSSVRIRQASREARFVWARSLTAPTIAAFQLFAQPVFIHARAGLPHLSTRARDSHNGAYPRPKRERPARRVAESGRRASARVPTACDRPFPTPFDPFRLRQRTLLCCQGQRRHLTQAAVEVAGECALDAAAGFAGGLARCEQALVVGGRFGVMVDAGEGDDVQSPALFNMLTSFQSSFSSICRE